jgi:uncharacterized protein (TIGR02001 family)
MHCSIAKLGGFGAASLLVAALFAAPASADGMPSKGGGVPGITVTGNVGLTTDYVFRGISQTNEAAAVQGGVELTYGGLYAGVAASSIESGVGTAEIDLYAGYKARTGRLLWDFGFIYYGYPHRGVDGPYENLDFYEIKAGVSTEIQKGLAVGATVFYSPDVPGFGSSEVVTYEGTIAYALPQVGVFSPTLSGVLGHVDSDFKWYDFDYTYWNVGVTFAANKWSFDVRYWDTDIDPGCNYYLGDITDSRVVGTVKYSF